MRVLFFLAVAVFENLQQDGAHTEHARHNRVEIRDVGQRRAVQPRETDVFG